MSSGIVQLVAIGAQDELIMGNPEISFFNSTFKRHSNFSQSIEKHTIYGSVKNNSLSTIRIERSGDLLGYTYLAPDDGTKSIDIQDWTNYIESIQKVQMGHTQVSARGHFFIHFVFFIAKDHKMPYHSSHFSITISN